MEAQGTAQETKGLPSQEKTVVVGSDDVHVVGGIEDNEENFGATGAIVLVSKGQGSLTVDKDVTATSNTKNAIGVQVQADQPGSKASAEVGGSVTATSNGGNTPSDTKGAFVDANGETKLTVGGDLKAVSNNEKAIGLSVNQWSDGKVDVTVAGTVEGDVGVRLENVAKAENINLNLWKIEAETPVTKSDKGNASDDAVSAVKNSINHIIKADGKGSDNYKALGIEILNDGLKSVTVGGTTYDAIAKAANALRFKVTAPTGQKVEAVYGYYPVATSVGITAQAASEALEVLQEVNGEYVLTLKDVPSGINLFVKYVEAQNDNGNSNSNTDNGNTNNNSGNDSKNETDNGSTNSSTANSESGVVSGKTEPASEQEKAQPAQAANVVKEAPAKETASKGDSSDSAAKATSAPVQAAAQSTPATGDEAPVAPIAAVMALAAAGAVVASRKLREE